MKKTNQNISKKQRPSEAHQTHKLSLNLSVLRTAAILLCFFVVGFFIYSNSLNAPFVFDDLKTIKENANIRMTEISAQNILKAARTPKGSISGRPFGLITFALNYYFHQYDPLGYHLVNIFIHILTCIVLFAFLKATLRLPSVKVKKNQAVIMAFVAALLWLVHPLQTQSVVYTVQRTNSMAATFFLLSLFLYARGRISQFKMPDGSAAGDEKAVNRKILRIRYLWFLGCGLSGIMALGCKQNAAVLPLVIYVYEWYFFQDLSWKWFKSSLKYIAAVVIIFAAVAFLYLGTDPLAKINKLRDFSHGEFTLAERALTQTRVVVYYLSLIFFPHPSRLNLDYDFPLSHSLFNPVTTLFSLILIIGLMALAFFLAKRERLISFCILWFFGNLVIESSIIPLAIIFEHRTYLPSMLVCLMPVILVYRYIRFDWLKIAVLIVLVVGLSIWTYQRNRVWQDDITLWSDVVNKSPDRARPHHNLGMALADRGMIDQAIAHYQKALQADPNYYESHVNLGKVLQDRGEIDAAVEHYLEALRIKPNNSVAHNNLGVMLYRKGQFSEAIPHFLKALQIRETYADAYFNLGMALARQGKTDEAVSRFYQALRLNPDYAEAHNNLGSVLVQRGQTEKAIRHYEEALRLDPQLVQAYNNLGIAFMQEGKIDEAIRRFQKALEVKPDFEMAENNLKKALAVRRKFEAEISRIQDLLKDDPDNVELHFQLGNLYVRKGNQSQAMQSYHKALQLNPKFVPALNNLALVAAANKEYDKALTGFLDVLNHVPDDAETHYNIACMYSRLNRVDESIGWLKKAIDKGYTNWERIKKDSDLDNIRESSAYKVLIRDH